MWPNFDRTAYTRDDFRKHVASLTWKAWKPNGITLHNTAAPTLAQWVESGPKHDARITNLQHYYEVELGWHSGPHLFISRDWINGFSNILAPGVHSRCWNSTRIGIEMVGDFSKEPFDSGDGAKVRDNAVFAIAVLNLKLGLAPDGLVFHKECNKDNHDCPGKLVNKSAVIARVKAKMAELSGQPAPDASPTNPGSKDVITRTDGLNLRRGAGQSFDTMGALPLGTVLAVMGEPTLNGTTKWLPVRTPAGYFGWVSMAYVEQV